MSLKDNDKIEQFGRNGYERVRASFNLEKVLCIQEAVYETFLNKW